MNIEKIREAYKVIVSEFCANVNKPGMVETPERMARMYEELFCNKGDICAKMKLFEGNSRDMVAKLNIEYYSLCEHHLVPFFGVVHIGYLPNEECQIIGISKLKRVVDYFSHNANTQEVLTTDIANFLYNHDDEYDHEFKPSGVIVQMWGLHLCEIMRGARNRNDSHMVTTAVRGEFMDNRDLKNEFMSLLQTNKR